MASGGRCMHGYRRIFSKLRTFWFHNSTENTKLLLGTSWRRFLCQRQASQCQTSVVCHKQGYCLRRLLSQGPISSRFLSQHLTTSAPCRVEKQEIFEDDSSKGSNTSSTPDPFNLVQADLLTLCSEIKTELTAERQKLIELTHYHFDGAGKAFRPMIVLLMAKTCNRHQEAQQLLFAAQKKVAMIAEMIHTASLVHDDVIDEAETRRGKPSVQGAWGQRNAVLTGNYIMSAASVILARTRHVEVVKILSQVLEDLVSGEFMQLGSKEDESERFNHYLTKTYKKTASLVANSCKAVAILGSCDEEFVEYAYQYGRNVGIAFQLVDDLLDFISTEDLMGKPTAADLNLGLATAPVLFAAHQHPELNPMIMRRFSEPGDVEKAWEMVKESDGISHTRYLANQHCREAVRNIKNFTESDERNALIAVTEKVLNRLK